MFLGYFHKLDAKKVQTCDKLWNWPNNKDYSFYFSSKPSKSIIFKSSYCYLFASRLKCYQVTGAMFLKKNWHVWELNLVSKQILCMNDSRDLCNEFIMKYEVTHVFYIFSVCMYFYFHRIMLWFSTMPALHRYWRPSCLHHIFVEILLPLSVP